MLCFNRINISEGINVNKTSESKEGDIFHNWYFLNKGIHFNQMSTNRCYDLLMMSINLINIAILRIKSADYRCIISVISKSEAIILMENADLTKKSGTLKNKKIIIIYKNG